MESHQQPTLEEMLFRLDMEEKMAARRRREKLDDDDNIVRHRMSCVNSSDILRTARNALNQYPRFSLDGKDAISRYLPSKIGGERVIWCKPGVVAKLMGLDALPVPLRCARRPNRETTTARVNGGDMIRRQNLRRRAEMERHERRDTELMNGSSCSTAKGYCVLKPVAKEDDDEVGGWPIRGGFLYSKHNLV
nr:NEDD4-like E3 ubiquitin-protein ligase [Ipomoea batatas]